MKGLKRNKIYYPQSKAGRRKRKGGRLEQPMNAARLLFLKGSLLETSKKESSE